MGSVEPQSFNVKRVAVIGAGPCGLSAAKYLVAQGAFDKIVIFEKQSEVAGVWLYSDRPTETLHIPQENAFCPPDPPITSNPPGEPPVFPTPMYGLLHTNIPKRLMQFQDQDFEKDSLIFPAREDVEAYLIKYSQDVRHLIRFSTQVNDVLLQNVDAADQWEVFSESLVSGERTTETFDAVVVASGHYSVPFLPNVKNIREFSKAHPSVITHAKLYRHPEQYRDQKVVVVGNAASGLDIATQISRLAAKPTLLSARHPTPPENLAHSGCEEVPVIEEFLVAERGVRFSDGRIERDLDAVIYCTGYLYTLPFLENLKPQPVTTGRRIHGIYKDLIHIEHPTLAFPGLPMKVVPLPFSESQAAIFSRVWANELQLPPADEMRRWEEDAVSSRKEGPHVYPKGGDADYINETHAWLKRASSKGKEPPLWDEELCWERTIYAEAKLKFEQTGRTAMSLGELGFHYTPSAKDEESKEIL
ncbi:uncharacterized protein E0L32_009121 [Thyridium curvatum]|uniref:Thiol-specific monooxygenase n=1 Tax=Thyridium curvatum TaxID=1093900 RepID=A0A507AXV8_9PEZI|nr:uncharacterized protein E0L32_009121 [Thyridium curvatum]TPX09648.1 hypothetical protein E0L32_009121 [Thyridium curvatum]